MRSGGSEQRSESGYILWETYHSNGLDKECEKIGEARMAPKFLA